MRNRSGQCAMQRVRKQYAVWHQEPDASWPVSAKALPYYYAVQTVTKAMATLGMTKQPARTTKAGASSREMETAPSR